VEPKNLTLERLEDGLTPGSWGHAVSRRGNSVVLGMLGNICE
jgi:hypothetical protein